MRFLWQFVIPVGVFIYCYSRIFHTIRRQNKTVSAHWSRSQGVVATATTSRDQHQQQQQTPGAKLSHTEMNVLQTMIAVIVVFVIFWSVMANFLQLLGVR